MSGAGAEKGDGRVAQQFTKTPQGVEETVALPLRIENKQTSTSSYTLTALDWHKISTAAARAGEHPLFHIELTVPGVGRVQLAIITESLSDALGVDGVAPWYRTEPARSFNISWKRWCVPHPYRAIHLRWSGCIYHLVLVDYFEVKKRIEEYT